MAEYDLIIRGGTIVDGTRTPRYVGDLAVVDGRIAKIGGLRGSSASRVLDASGLIVAPGFVDLHTHYDAQIQWDPYCTISGWHGVTSVAIGNCGFGFAPCAPNEGERDRLMLALTRNEAIPFEAMKLGMLWDWVTFPEFLSSIERIPKGLNVMSYVPLAPIYAWVMGYDEAKSRHPTEAELEEMCRLVHIGMDAGGCGWSAQVFGPTSEQRDYDATPMITDMMTDDELLAFGHVLAERDEGFIELAYRGEIGEDGRPMQETAMSFYERLAEVSNRPVLYQVVSLNSRNPEQHRRMLRWLEDCAKRRVRVYGQGQTFRGDLEITFEDFNLFDDSPAWRDVTLGKPPVRKEKMQDPEVRRRLREEWDSGFRPNPELEESAAGLLVVEVGRGELEHYVGRKVGEIARQEGKHVVDALLDLVVADNLKTEFFASIGGANPQYTAEVVQSPHVIPGISDGGAHVKFLTGGCFPTETIAWLVRDEGLVSLEEAHYNLSYLPAHFGGLRDRGLLREGAPADIVAYDLERLSLVPSEVVHDLPGGDWRRIQRAEGYRWVFVNGQMTFEDGTPTGALPGKLLRHGKG